MEAGKQERSSRRRSLVIAGDGPLAPPKQRAQKGLLLLQLPWLVKVARKRRKNQKICGSRATKRVGFCVKRIAPKNRFFLFSARLYYQVRPLRPLTTRFLFIRFLFTFFFTIFILFFYNFYSYIEE